VNTHLQTHFIDQWNRYFPGADLPIAFFYTDEPGDMEVAPPSETHRCMICDLAKVRHGTPLAFNTSGAVCSGAKRYLGFSQQLMPNFSYFLSCGIEGKLEGERYKKSPAIVEDLMTKAPHFEAPARYIVFKRWDMLVAADEPVVVVFFAPPDVLSGLFTLSGFETSEVQAVIAPFAAGCGSIVQYPYLELDSEHPRAVLGMFDVSARPCVPEQSLTFAIPMPKFERMVADMDQSFLITESWHKVQKRLAS